MNKGIAAYSIFVEFPVVVVGGGGGGGFFLIFVSMVF